MKRVEYFSFLRAIACIAIVILHTFHIAYQLFDPSGAAATAVVIIRNCMEWAVPCFIMVSGALLLDPERKIPIRKIFRKYIRRVFLALLIFTLVSVLFDAALDNSIRGFHIVTEFCRRLYTGNSWLHLWYLYMVIGLYLMLPVYRALVRGFSQRVYIYMMTLFFVFLSVLATITSLSGQGTYFTIMVSAVYPLYFFLGYGIHFRRFSISRTFALILVAAGEGSIILLTYFGERYPDTNIRLMVSQYSFIGVVALSFGVFSLMKRIRGIQRGARKFLLAVDRNSFGIYLIHVLVLYTIYRALRFNPFAYGGIAMLFLLVVIVAAISWGITWLLKKVPFIRTIV